MQRSYGRSARARSLDRRRPSGHVECAAIVPNRGPYGRSRSAWNRPKAPAEGAAVLSARLLRRGGARDRHGRAGARPLRRAGLCAPRDRAQPLCGREPQGQGRDLRRGARRDSRHRRAGDLFRPRRAEIDPGRGAEAQLLRARRHLPAGHQGPSRGRDPPQARARDRADRPCRPSRGGRNDRPAPGRRHHAGAVGRRGREPSSRAIPAISPM